MNSLKKREGAYEKYLDRKREQNKKYRAQKKMASKKSAADPEKESEILDEKTADQSPPE